MTINDLSPTEDVVVSLSINAENATEMYIFGDVDESHAIYGDQVERWIPYASSANIALTNYNGTKDIDIKYRNADGGESTIITQQITLQLPIDFNSSGGGSGNPSVAILSSTQAGDAITLPTSVSEVIYAVSNIGTGDAEVTLEFDITALDSNNIVDSRLIEIGYFNEFDVWKTYSNVEIDGNLASVAIPRDAINPTLLARIVDAEVLSIDFNENSFVTDKPVLLPDIAENLNYSLVLSTSEVQVEIPANTMIQTETGERYSGILYPPTILESAPPILDPEIDVGTMIFIGSTATSLTFNQPVRLIFSVPENINFPKLAYYDTESGEYLLARDVLDDSLGGALSADGDTISVWVNHMTIYLVISVNDYTTLELLEEKSRDHYVGGGFGIGIFSDLTPDHWAHDSVSELWNLFIISGYPDGMFRPDTPINRAEFTKIALLAFYRNDLKAIKSRDNFPDVPSGEWFSDLIAKARTLQIISGYEDGNFRSAQFINRAEALKILTLASGLKLEQDPNYLGFTDVEAKEWYAPFVQASHKAGLIQGYSVPRQKLLVLEKNLGFGASGEEVIKLQQILAFLNFYHEEPNGKFDSKTQNALFRYQI